MAPQRIPPRLGENEISESVAAGNSSATSLVPGGAPGIGRPASGAPACVNCVQEVQAAITTTRMHFLLNIASFADRARYHVGANPREPP